MENVINIMSTIYNNKNEFKNDFNKFNFYKMYKNFKLNLSKDNSALNIIKHINFTFSEIYLYKSKILEINKFHVMINILRIQ